MSTSKYKLTCKTSVVGLIQYNDENQYKMGWLPLEPQPCTYGLYGNSNSYIFY